MLGHTNGPFVRQNGVGNRYHQAHILSFSAQVNRDEERRFANQLSGTEEVQLAGGARYAAHTSTSVNQTKSLVGQQLLRKGAVQQTLPYSRQNGVAVAASKRTSPSSHPVGPSQSANGPIRPGHVHMMDKSDGDVARIFTDTVQDEVAELTAAFLSDCPETDDDDMDFSSMASMGTAKSFEVQSRASESRPHDTFTQSATPCDPRPYAGNGDQAMALDSARGRIEDFINRRFSEMRPRLMRLFDDEIRALRASIIEEICSGM